MNAFLSAYLFLFGVAAIACLVSAYWAWKIAGPDTGDGDGDTGNALLALLLTSAGWAGTYVGAFLAPTPGLERAFYMSGLVIGAAAVGAWLWFCSAYSGRTLHRETAVQRTGLLVFLLVAGTKLTNSWHGLYFSTEMVEAPFPHLQLHYHALYWGSVGLAYALAAVGYFMLFELFREVGSKGGKLGMLAGLTALPLLFNGLGEALPWLLNVSHEPLGVAAFAIGVTFLYRDQFRAVEIAGDRQAPVFVMEPNGTILDYNRSAADLFPAMIGGQKGIGKPPSEVLPALARALDTEKSIIRLQQGSQQRYFQLGVSSFAIQGTRPCQALLLTDVTERRRMQERLLDVQEEERRRIDQEIHDEMGGLLTSLQFAIDCARNEALDQNDPADAFSQVEGLVSELSTTARTISRKLYPSALSDHGLAGALTSLLGDLEREHGLKIDLVCEIGSEERLSTLHKRTAYWIVQEALINVARHAETNEAKVTIGTDQGRLSLQIVDEGAGFDPSKQEEQKSFGLESIRRRVERLNGEVQISSIPGEGSCIRSIFPLEALPSRSAV